MKKLIALFCILAMQATLICGCSTAAENNSSENAGITSEAASSTSVQTSGSTEAVATVSYPISDGSEAVTCWMSLPPHVSPYLKDVAQSAAYRAASEATGIDFKITSVSSEAESSQFALMMAGQSYSDYDIIVGGGKLYGSTGAAVDEDIFMDLTDYIEQDMPDWYSFLQSDSEVKKLLTTDNGQIGDIAGRASGGVPHGLGIRKDWLDELGLSIPTTYDQFYDVLTAFKNKYNCAQPLLMMSNGFLDSDMLAAGLGVTRDNSDGWYVDNGTVKFSLTGDGLKQYVTMLNKWYSEGLISSDFINNTSGAGINYDSDMLDDTCGVYCTGMDIFNSSNKAQAADPDWEVVPIADITPSGTETITIAKTPSSDPLSNKWNVTTGVSDDRIKTVLNFVNWFFTDAGKLACNYGIAGEAFEYDSSNTPQYTDLITNNPQGSFIAQAIYLNWNASYCLDETTFDALYEEAQITAKEIWNSNRTNSSQYHGDLTSEEASEYSTKYSDIKTYVEEMVVTFITGDSDVNSEWDTYVSTIDGMGLSDCQKLKQDAYDRYQNR